MIPVDKTYPLPPALEQSVPVALFKSEVTTWADRIGVEPVLITVRPMKRKWGSCSSAGRLTFDRDLLYQPTPFRAEVIVHELLHIKYPYPRHGKVFRSLVKSYLAQYGLVE
ncbi:MAG: M48 family metallopeptidase [Chloroflexota bacterium]|nr:M48 family metallopeptidase [Chloroflexota bacterium]